MAWTYKLDVIKHDLIIGTDGKLERTNGSDEVAQRIKVALWHDFGEYFIHVDDGLPWREILGSIGDSSLVSNIIRNAILSVPGVTQLVDFKIRYGSFERAYSVDVNLIVQSGPGDEDRDAVIINGIEIPIGVN